MQTVFKPFRPWKLDLLSSERVGLESAPSSTIRTINFPTPPPTISLRSNKHLPSFSFTDMNKSSTHSVSTREETRFQKNERNEPVTISYIPLIVTLKTERNQRATSNLDQLLRSSRLFSLSLRIGEQFRPRFEIIFKRAQKLASGVIVGKRARGATISRHEKSARDFCFHGQRRVCSTRNHARRKTSEA